MSDDKGNNMMKSFQSEKEKGTKDSTPKENTIALSKSAFVEFWSTNPDIASSIPSSIRNEFHGFSHEEDSSKDDSVSQRKFHLDTWNANGSTKESAHASLKLQSDSSSRANDLICKPKEIESQTKRVLLNHVQSISDATVPNITLNAAQKTKTVVASDTVRKSIYPSNRKMLRPYKASRKTAPFLDYIPRSRYEIVKHVSLPTAKEIQDNIPSNASSIFHIMDRRIDFDSLTEDATCYELLRAWVKDDPYRVLPRKHGNILDHVELDQDWNVKAKNHPIVLHSTKSSESFEVQSNSTSKESTRLNILDGNHIGKSSVMEMKKYLKGYVAQGNAKKRHSSSELKKRDQRVLKQLKKKIPQFGRSSK